MIPAVASAAGVLLPLGYLVVRACEAEPQELAATVLRWRNVQLLVNTLGLTAGVLAVTTAVALPTAWLTARCDAPLRGLFTLATVLPLALPGYLMAYTLLSLGGNVGVIAKLTGHAAPVLSGYTGALVALSLYNYPYMVLNLRAALHELDPHLEEMARALGHRPGRAFFTVVLPQLRPALLAGGLLVGLHVITDFGVVSLMNYETFSYALYLQYEVFDTVYAAWLALMLMGVAGVFVGAELWLLRGVRVDRAGVFLARPRQAVSLGRWRWPAAGALGLLVFLSVLTPAGTILYQAAQADWGGLRTDLVRSMWDSLAASAPAAVLATMLAVPIAYMARHYPSKRTLAYERLSYLGYATPSLAFALGLLVMSLKVDELLVEPGRTLVYQSLSVLVYAYALHFLAEAVGPVRAALFQSSPRLEEAARSLGRSRLTAFVRVTLPLLKQGLVVSLALVFLSAMKELPLTFLLAPLGFGTLATNVWTYSHEANFVDAAPFALLIMAVSSAFVGVLLYGARKRT